METKFTLMSHEKCSNVTGTMDIIYEPDAMLCAFETKTDSCYVSFIY